MNHISSCHLVARLQSKLYSLLNVLGDLLRWKDCRMIETTRNKVLRLFSRLRRMVHVLLDKPSPTQWWSSFTRFLPILQVSFHFTVCSRLTIHKIILVFCMSMTYVWTYDTCLGISVIRVFRSSNRFLLSQLCACALKCGEIEIVKLIYSRGRIVLSSLLLD